MMPVAPAATQTVTRRCEFGSRGRVGGGCVDALTLWAFLRVEEPGGWGFLMVRGSRWRGVCSARRPEAASDIPHTLCDVSRIWADLPVDPRCPAERWAASIDSLHHVRLAVNVTFCQYMKFKWVGRESDRSRAGVGQDVRVSLRLVIEDGDSGMSFRLLG
jgi:hypothetical protein